jgi:ApbE superfamily uncharacterized protein (UPF0280 family)
MFPDLLKNLKNFGSYQLKKIIDIKDRIEQERVTIETYIQNNPDLRTTHYYCRNKHGQQI